MAQQSAQQGALQPEETGHSADVPKATDRRFDLDHQVRAQPGWAGPACQGRAGGTWASCAQSVQHAASISDGRPVDVRLHNWSLSAGGLI
jgi:hypothetical protein